MGRAPTFYLPHVLTPALTLTLSHFAGEGYLVLLGRIGKQGDGAGALEGCGQRPLVSRARARHAAWQDLASVAHEPAQTRDLLVVDVRDLLHAETAYLAVLPLRPARRLSLCWWCR